MSGFCGPTESLTPFVVLFPTLYIQHWINMLMVWRRTRKAKPSKTDAPPKLTVKDVIQGILKVWNIIALVVTFILDIIFVAQSKDTKGFQTYNCYIMVMFNSPNWKRVLSIMLIMANTFNDRDNAEKEDENVEKTDENADQPEVELEPYVYEAGTNATATEQNQPVKRSASEAIGIIIEEHGVLTLCLLVVSFVWFIAFFPMTWTHFIPSCAFGWILIGVFGVVLLLSAVLSKICCVWFQKVIGVDYFLHIQNKDYTACFLAALKSPLVYGAIYLCIITQLSAVSYWYGGDSYSRSVERVFQERSFENFLAGFDSIFTFFGYVHGTWRTIVKVL
eukprot:119019_1